MTDLQVGTYTFDPTTTTNVNLANKCGWCNGWHSGRCPKVKAIEYHPNGAVKRVEFK